MKCELCHYPEGTHAEDCPEVNPVPPSMRVIHTDAIETVIECLKEIEQLHKYRYAYTMTVIDRRVYSLAQKGLMALGGCK